MWRWEIEERGVLNFLMILQNKKHSNESIHEISLGIIIHNTNRKKLVSHQQIVPIC